MSHSPSSNLLIEVKELGSGSQQDDLPLSHNVHIADEGLTNECDDTLDLMGYIQIRSAALAIGPVMSTPSRDLVSVVF